jgi:hypothetical protein
MQPVNFITVYTTANTGPYHEPDESSPDHPILFFFQMHYNIILPSMPSLPV